MTIDESFEGGQLDAVMLIADSAQVSEGKLFVLGGGLRLVGPHPQPMSIGLLISVPWHLANISHSWKVELLDADGMPVLHNSLPIVVQGNFEAGRPAGWLPGTPLPVPLAINFSALPVEPGGRYAWRLAIDDDSDPRWQAGFSVRPAPTGTA